MEKRNKMKVLFTCFIFSFLFCKLTNASPPANPEELKIEEKKLHVPTLGELENVFRTELLKNFAEVKVEIVDSPDFTKAPFNLAAPGLGGSQTLLDVGGFSLYDPDISKQKLFDLKTIVQKLKRKSEVYVMGAASGPGSVIGTDCDLAVNVFLGKETTSSSYVITLDKNRGKIVCKPLSVTETRFSVQGSLYLSDGQKAKVLKVYVKKRKGEDSFIASLRRSITNQYGENKLVGMAGVFVLQEGKASELFPNLANEPAPKGSSLRSIKNYFIDEGPAKMTGVGTFVSSKTNLLLTPNHFHCFSTNEYGGHYVRDTTPATVEYEGYFVTADLLVRIDQAPSRAEFDGSDNF